MQVRNRLRLAQPSAPSGLAFDPEYERFAVAELDGSITIYRLRDQTELFRLQAAGKPNTAALLFSPKGQFLAERYYGAPTNECRVWDLSRRRWYFGAPWTCAASVSPPTISSSSRQSAGAAFTSMRCPLGRKRSD